MHRRSDRPFFMGLALAVAAGLVGGCASVPPPHPAATVPPPSEAFVLRGPLSAEAALAAARAHDPELRALRHRVSAAYWRKVEASLLDNPRIGGTVDPLEWVARLTLQIGDLLDLGGRRRARVQAAQSREEVAALAVLERELELAHAVRVEVATAWAEAAAAPILQARLELLGDLVATARAQRALGELAATDVLALERRLLEARMAVDDAALARREAAARLNRRLGRAPEATLELATPGPAVAWAGARDALSPPPGVDDLAVDLGLVRRPQLAILAARASEQRAALDLARVSWLAGEVGPHLKQSDGSVVAGAMASVAVPIFDHGRARKGVHESELAALAEDMLAVQADVLLEVHVAWWRHQRAQQSASRDAAALRAIAGAEHTLLEQARGLGGASQVAVRHAWLRVLDADLALIEARRDELFARAELAAALGDRGDASRVTERGEERGEGRDGDGSD